MGALRTLSDRSQLRAAGLLLLLAVLAIVLVAVAPTAAVLLVLAGTGVVGLLGLTMKSARTRRSAPRRYIPETTSAAALRLTMPDGATVAARPVALGTDHEGALLLTREGYVVVDAGGRVLHRI